MIDQAQLSGILRALCPMHVIVNATGHITCVGPTLAKLRPDQTFLGTRFLETFEMTRPRMVNCMADLLALKQTRVKLRFRDAPETALKGVMITLPGGAGAVVGLSFGISILDAVRDYQLTEADFAATDLAIELLYLVEAKTAAMEASRSLNLRLQGAKIAAEEQAFTDTLTGVKNRRALDHILSRLAGRKTPFSLMHLDLDLFKAVNDTYGHAAGDQVLQTAARIMVEQTRSEDTVARIGGDEFVLLFEGDRDAAKLAGIADRLIRRIEAPICFEGQECAVSASIGIARADCGTQSDPLSILHHADLALYCAKRAGRGRHRFFTPDMLSPQTPQTPQAKFG